MRWSAAPALMKRDLRAAYSTMLEDEEAVTRAQIEVERINGPILLVSATRDEMWPSAEMSGALVRRLERADFAHHYQHLAIEGDHAEPLEHFDEIFDFLIEHFNN
jgi:pimeloyl-ACP methyl ester carboxylesterase